MTTETQRIIFTGRVQGVGFRWSTAQIAHKLPVKGYVRNLATGQVELMVCGDTSAVESLISAICQRFEGRIDAIEREDRPEHAEFSDFRIQRW